MMKDQCGTCRFWGATNKSISDYRIGFCRRNPPTIIERLLEVIDLSEDAGTPCLEATEHGVVTATAFPETFEDMWCGKHRSSPDEWDRRTREAVNSMTGNGAA